MRVVGVIAEYDPFHLGHAHHLRQARTQAQADWVVCVMSGCFTQRGQGALLSPARRARMALECGADAVLELPVPWAVREAEHFALGGVSILHSLGCVTHLSFGAETDDLPALARCAALLEASSPELDAAVQAGLAQGLSHPAALGQALEAYFPGLALAKPNNVLALCYLRALQRLRSPILPVLVPRCGDYHATGWNGGYPSATAVRGAFRRGDWTAVARAMPREACAILRDAARQGEIFHGEALDPVLLHLLRNAGRQSLQALPGCTEGMENRLQAAARRAVNRRELLAAAKTRRYPYARLSRLCAHLLLGLTARDLLPGALPPYARLLGFRREARPLLRAMKASGFPLLEKAAAASREDPVFQADMRAYDLWCLGAGLRPGLGYRQQLALTE